MQNKPLELRGRELTIDAIYEVAYGQRPVAIATSCKQKIEQSRKLVETIGESYITYGVNTGFGPMANYVLSNKQVNELQYNLIRSHAVGLGECLADELVIAVMLVRLNTLLQGHSGVRPEVVEQLEFFINNRIAPRIPEHGSVGASGDLVQLAHVALALIGDGKVSYNGTLQPTRDVLKALQREPLSLQSKEGLALINGTSAMSAIAALVAYDARRQLDRVVRLGAMAYEIFHGYDDPISETLQALRPHPGQIYIAEQLRHHVAGSGLLKQREALQKQVTMQRDDVEKIDDKVQDVYSVRCMPQIYGPIYETLQYAEEVIAIEINSVTDNPIVDTEAERMLHGGNFHGDYISLEMDKVKIALSRIALTIERHLNILLNPNVQKELAPFLNLSKPGLDLALQGMQFVATSTTAEIQTLCFPNYVHSITTNADNQDIVSMGTNSALLTKRVVHNLDSVIAVYASALAQAVDCMDGFSKLSQNGQDIYTFVRTHLKKVEKDRDLTDELQHFREQLILF